MKAKKKILENTKILIDFPIATITNNEKKQSEEKILEKIFLKEKLLEMI